MKNDPFCFQKKRSQAIYHLKAKNTLETTISLPLKVGGIENRETYIFTNLK